MRSAALASVLLVLGVCAGVALGDGLPVPIPTVSTPTVTVPPPPVLPVPTLPAPTLPISSPQVSVPAPAPSAPVVSQSTAAVGGVVGSASSSSASSSSASGGSLGSGGSAGSGSTSAGGSGSTSGGGSGSTSGGSSRSSQRASVSRLRMSRSWISTSGPKSRRRTILVFRLAHSATVSFTVFQVSPLCGLAGKFVVHGHPGVNRVRFSGKVHGRQLGPGTYRIDARARGGARVLHVTLVVVSGMPSASELHAARHSNVCAATLAANATRTSAGFTAVSRTLRGPPKTSIVRHQNPIGTGPSGHRSSAAPFSAERVSQNATNPLVVAAFGLAVILLGLAALPQRAVPDPRLNDVLVRHRIEVAMAGAGALAAALLALALA